ncbi:MAG: hypothetical protein FWG74_06480, partial [Planctomycetes bacterium]|nr:hypothetical protein [Planctomycetota bacterium]
LTGSLLAQSMLDNPNATRSRFTRIMPVGWARMNDAIAQAQAQGASVEDGQAWDQDVWTHILEVAHHG